jgi:hypothetical protein
LFELYLSKTNVKSQAWGSSCDEYEVKQSDRAPLPYNSAKR